MRQRWYDKRRFRRWGNHLYRQKALIKRIWYLDPDGNYNLEDKEVTWCKGMKSEHEGWCACSLQLVCPMRPVVNFAYGNCKRECHDPLMREALEAYITLKP